MFLILVRRELLANLMTFRFLVAMVVTLSLVVANTVVLNRRLRTPSDELSYRGEGTPSEVFKKNTHLFGGGRPQSS